MKRCPTCNRTYPDDAPGFCPHDATTLVSDAPANNPLPPTQAASYGNQQQQYTPQQYAPQQQWTPPQQQWGAPQPARGGNKALTFGLIGLVLAVGIGLTVYFLTRHRSSAHSYSSIDPTVSNSSTGSSSSSGSFTGTWRPAPEFSDMRVQSLTISDNGTYTIRYKDSHDSDRTGTWSSVGSNLTLKGDHDRNIVLVLESDGRLSVSESGKKGYFVRE